MEFAEQWHLHPMIVHFPVALFVSAFIFEALSVIFKKEQLHKTAWSVFLLAAVVAPMAVRTGLWAEEEHHIKHPILELHERFALLTMYTSLVGIAVCWAVGKKFPRAQRAVFLALTLLTAVCVSSAGFYGGKMVYEYGIGIEE